MSAFLELVEFFNRETGLANQPSENSSPEFIMLRDGEGILITGFGHHEVRALLAGNCPTSTPQLPNNFVAGT